MKKPSLLLFVSALTLVFAVSASAGAPAGPDANKVSGKPRVADAQMQKVYEYVLANKGEFLDTGDLCAIGSIPGPGDGFNIRFGFFNVIADVLNVAVIDSFNALGGASLLHESVFSVTSPQGGATTIDYPGAVSGRGPVVASFSSFDLFDSTSFNTDPDTYDDPAFGATVTDLNGTVVELVYAGDKRCRGVFVFNAGLNASLALIVQVHP